MDDEDAAGAEALEDVGEGLGEVGGEDADELAGRAGGVCERAEEVEKRAHPEFPADGPGVAHGLVEGRREEEGDADFVECLLHDLGIGLEVQPQGLEAVGAAAAARAGAVAVLGDGRAGAGGDEGDRGGDVERHAAIPARADGVERVGLERLDAPRGGAHGGGAAADLGDGDALGLEQREKRAHLRGRHRAGENGGDGVEGFGFGQILAGDEFVEECFHDRCQGLGARG